MFMMSVMSVMMRNCFLWLIGVFGNVLRLCLCSMINVIMGSIMSMV